MNDSRKVLAAGEMREVVELDGKDYVEIDGDVVQFCPVRVEVEVKGRKVVFAEGERYRNYFGEAEVWHIRRDGIMVVKYVRADRSGVCAGRKYEYPVRSQAEAVVNEGIRAEAELSRRGVAVVGGDAVPLMEWIARKGSIRAQMRPEMRERFEADYEALTGEKADFRHVLEGKGYWENAYALCADFPAPQEGSDVKVPQGLNVLMAGGRCHVWNNAFVRGMLKEGLRLGRNEGFMAKAA